MVVIATTVGACGSQSTGEAATGGPSSSFTDRAGLSACGEIRLGQGETVPGDAWACLDSAAGAGAELVVEMPTTEGDPVLTYYRVGPAIDGLEIYRDATQDEFGPGTWSHELCPDTITASEPLGCVDL